MGNGLRTSAWAGLESLRPMLHKYLARRCVDEHEVDDVIQESFLRAAKYRSNLTEASQLRAWTFRIAANLLSDRVSRRVRWKSLEAELERSEPATEADTVHEAQEVELGGWSIERDDALQHLDAAIQELRGEDQVLLRSFYDGRGRCRDVAQECGIEPHLVKVRLFRARQRLQRVLRRRLALTADLTRQRP